MVRVFSTRCGNLGPRGHTFYTLVPIFTPQETQMGEGHEGGHKYICVAVNCHAGQGADPLSGVSGVSISWRILRVQVRILLGNPGRTILRIQ